MKFAATTLRFAAAGALCIGFAAGALAETAKKDKEKAAEAPKPALVATYGDWNVYRSEAGKTRLCYALAQPKTRDPADIKRDPAYAFISERPAERARNEVSFVMGFELGGGAAPKAEDPKDKKKDVKKPKDEAVSPTAAIGDVEFGLVPKGTNLWLKNAAEENQIVDTMRKGVTLRIKAASKKGSVTVDTYSLAGFSQAIDRAMKDCPAP